jgi:hypothetical protein
MRRAYNAPRARFADKDHLGGSNMRRKGVLSLAVILALLVAPQLVSAQGEQTIPARPTTPDLSPAPKQVGAANKDKSPTEGIGGFVKAVGIANEIDQKKSQIRDAVIIKSLIDTFLKTQESVSTAYADAKTANCTSTEDIHKLGADFGMIDKSVSAWWAMSQEIQRLEGRVLNQFLPPMWWQDKPDEKCAILKEDSTQNDVQNSFKEASMASKNYGDEIDKLTSELSNLYASRDSLVGSQTAIKNVTQNLPWLLLIIAAFGFAVMGIVYFFQSDIQMEWVASGQVIQFATVMILLSTLMALGLTDVLHEQVLGTLLGGIAGYVLAQGVGRATARQTLNAAAAAASAPPPGPPPPPAAPPGPPPPPAAPPGPPPPHGG